jgi:putative nucleotidyltransferase with HDIG domain
MAKILLVDDDENLRDALKRILIKEGHIVEIAWSGKVAQSILLEHDFEIIISDIKMPDGDGIELTKFIRKNKIQIPIVLMTGFSEIYSVIEAYELGANEFIPKPFKKEDLLESIEVCLKNPKLNQEIDNISDGFCKLSLIDFVSGKSIPADVFLRLSDKKFIKIANKGDEFPVYQLEKFKKFGVIHLYMKKEDFNDYIGFNLLIGKKLQTSSKISKEKKINFMKHTNEVIMERLFLNEIDKEMFDLAQTVTESTVGMIMEDDKIFNLLEMLNSNSDDLYAHSIGVSLFGAMLCRQLEWTSPATLFKVSTGGLLHDIGKKELPKELNTKLRSDMNHEEITLYESHPLRGMKILSEIRTIPADILQIVSQHHENCLGLGFPAKLSRHHIYPLARLVSIIDIFCNLTIGKKSSPGLSIKEALNQMLAVDATQLDKEMFLALLKLFKIKPPPILK